MPPIRLSDSELAAVFDAAKPLAIDLRDPFLRAVAHELQGCREIGPGVVHQVCREQQRIFMNAPGRISLAQAARASIADRRRGDASRENLMQNPALCCHADGDSLVTVTRR
jgi:hypothetical protein